jgi:hypothetical protein
VLSVQCSIDAVLGEGQFNASIKTTGGVCIAKYILVGGNIICASLTDQLAKKQRYITSRVMYLLSD